MSLILGSGFTGMAAGIKTEFPIYEATNKSGGICTTYVKDGFQFSHGGPHFIFGSGPGLDFIKNTVEVKNYNRIASVYYNHSFPYPFQTSAEKDNPSNPGTLKHWLSNKFSRESCNLFFNPFNSKHTAGLYNEVIQSDEFKTPPAGSQGFVSTFGDPVGGLSYLVDKMAEKCKIRYNKRAVSIRPEEKTVLFQDGEEVRYDKLISTIPLNQLLWMCGKKDIDLPYSSVLVLNIGAEPDSMTPKDHWTYVPFCRTNFHRLCFYSNVDKSKAPEGKVGMAVEIAFPSEYDFEDLDIPFIIDQVVKELQDWRFIGKVITVDPTWVKTAYTWLRKKEDRENALAWLKERDIISTGRYGKWAFQGMVQSIEDGLNVAL